MAPLVAVPPAVVTETSTAPAACAGVIAMIVVALSTVKLVAATPPIVTAVAPVKFVPVIVMLVPPNVLPVFGLMEPIVGAGVKYVNTEDIVAVPPGVVTAISTSPAACGGVTMMIVVELITVTLVAATPPTTTPTMSVKLVPVMVTAVPPSVLPVLGPIEPIVGIPANTVIEAVALLPVPMLEVRTLVVLTFTPGLVAVTLTDSVQEATGLSVAFSSRSMLPPAVTVPSHELFNPDGEAMTNPAG